MIIGTLTYMGSFTAGDIFITLVPVTAIFLIEAFTFFYLKYSKHNFIEGKHPIEVY